MKYALITGRFAESILKRAMDNDSIIVTLTVSNPITNGMVDYETKLKEDGTFSFTVPIVCPVYARFTSDLSDGTIF